MTRKRIELMREVVIPFVKKKLLEIDYEGLGESDAEEFENDINEVLELAIKALEQEPCEDAVSQKLDEWDLHGERAELWIIRGKLQIRCMGTVHNINYPPVTPARKKGKWVKSEHDGMRMIVFECSNCGSYYPLPDGLNFCPHCGADMRGESK